MVNRAGWLALMLALPAWAGSGTSDSGGREVLAEQAFEGGVAQLWAVSTGFNVSLKLLNPTKVRVRAHVLVTLECSVKKPTTVTKTVVLQAAPGKNDDFGNTVDCPGLSPRTGHQAKGRLVLGEEKWIGDCLIQTNGQLKLPAVTPVSSATGITALHFKGKTTQTIRMDTLEQQLSLDAGVGQAVAFDPAWTEKIAELICKGAVDETKGDDLSLAGARNALAEAFKRADTDYCAKNPARCRTRTVGPPRP
ncbi:MAG: hypothetical protein H6Q89_2146 [Myxococcaceae bacterium]|nr:hypothetical protein [Myxococcaceae bacterium]